MTNKVQYDSIMVGIAAIVIPNTHHHPEYSFKKAITSIVIPNWFRDLKN